MRSNKIQKVLITGMAFSSILLGSLSVPVAFAETNQSNERTQQAQPTVQNSQTNADPATAQEQQTTLWDIEDENDVQYDKPGEQQQQSESEIAVINGESVQLDPPEKATKYDADTTQAPKEALQRSIQRFSRSVKVATSDMYRLYNPNSGEHFYTKDTNERDHLRQVGWRYEGIGWKAPFDGDPVYRMYNPNAGDHHYTISSSERDNLKQHGWRYEGISWYSDSKYAIKVYRAYNPNAKSGSHNYTINNNEQVNLINHGWRNEGVGWYAASSEPNNTQSPDQGEYKLLGVRNYDQYALGAPSGCEGASLLQALQYKGIATDKDLHTFLTTIPLSQTNDPNTGFVGTPFEENAWTYSAIYPAPLTKWASQYSNKAANLSGSSYTSLINEVRAGNPVVTWVTINFQPIRWGRWHFGIAANNNHAVTLDGFNTSSNQVHVSDPISGSYWLNAHTFQSIYEARKYAVVIR